MEKKFMLTLHVSESELPELGSFFHARQLKYKDQNDNISVLRCSTMQYMIESSMSEEMRTGPEYTDLKKAIETFHNYQKDNKICPCGIITTQANDKCQRLDCLHKNIPHR